MRLPTGTEAAAGSALGSGFGPYDLDVVVDMGAAVPYGGDEDDHAVEAVQADALVCGGQGWNG